MQGNRWVVATLLIGVFWMPERASAKLTKEQEARVGAASFVHPDFTLTVEQFAEFRLPERHCATWVTVPMPFEHVPEVTIVHVVEHSDGPYLLITSKHKHATEFDLAVLKVAEWWGIAERGGDWNWTTTDRGDDLTAVVRGGEEMRSLLRSDGLVTAVLWYTSHGVTRVQQKCMDLPTWVVRVHPLVPDRVTAF